MSDLKINQATRELELDNGDLQLTETTEAIQQHLAQRLRTFFAEWFLDRRIGIPYFEQVLIKSFNPEVLDTIFKNAILNTPGVLELIEFDIDLDNATRVMTLTFKANTLDGVIDFSEILGVV